MINSVKIDFLKLNQLARAILSTCMTFVMAAYLTGFLTGGSRVEAAVAPTALSPLKLTTFLSKPKLIVVIVIDQFRADYLTRFEKRFLPTTGKSAPGGFRFLMEKGAYFPFAEYDVLQNMTCSGHAMILTGALPYTTHIPSNEFYDPKMEKFVYCVQDEAAQLVGVDVKGTDGGASPRRLKTSTFGDEVKNAGYGTKAVSIALKDRAAIMLGGHRADLAIWFDQKKMKWISSQYYLSSGELPDWLNQLNAKITKSIPSGGKYIWKADGVETGLSNGTPEKIFSREFGFGSRELLSSPYGLELTTQAALEAARAYKLGQGKDTDILTMSYSSHDAMGHTWGPNSREMEEMTIAEDRTLNDLFKGLAKTVPGGMNNILFVLTADHGMAPTVPYSKQAHFESIEIDDVAVLEKMNVALEKKYGPPSRNKWVLGARYLNFYLNLTSLSEKKIPIADAEEEVKQILIKEKGIANAFTSTDYKADSLPPAQFRHQIMNSYVLGVSGDVVAIPHTFSYNGDHPTHISGYSYDRTVPLILAGKRMKAGVFSTPARVNDLAPTLSFIMGVLPPATNEGRVLSEALAN